jgi:hypothetical protein
MANVKISQLTAKAAKVESTDRIPIADYNGSTYDTKYVTGAEINELKLDTSPQLGGNLDVNGHTITSDSDQDVIINPNGTGTTKIESNLVLRDSAGATAKEVLFYEGFSNGTNYVGLKAADSLTANTTYTLPTADGTSGQVLSTNGTGTLSWTTNATNLTWNATTITGGTNGGILFQNSGLLLNSANLVFNNTLGLLSLGQGTSPSARLDIRAQGALETDIIFRVRNTGNTANSFSFNGFSVIAHTNGTAPTANVTDSYQLYSADITAGNAAPHIQTENGNIIKIYQETTGVAAATLTGGGGTTLTDTDTFDGYTLKQVVKALRNLGILA